MFLGKTDETILLPEMCTMVDINNLGHISNFIFKVTLNEDKNQHVQSLHLYHRNCFNLSALGPAERTFRLRKYVHHCHKADY